MRRLLLSLGLVLLPGLALAQSEDQGILTRFLQDRLSGAGREVQITGFQGALSSRATMQQLTIADSEGIWLTLNGVTLDWNRAAVLRGDISVNELSAREVIVARPPVSEPSLPSPEARGFSLPELPVSVNIRRIAAEHVELGAPVLGTPLEGALTASLTLAGGQGSTEVNLIRTDAGPTGRVSLRASYANTSRLLVLDLDAQEAAGGIAATKLGLPGAPATALSIKGEGIVDNFGADIVLATDGTTRLSGRLGLQTAESGDRLFSARLGGDPAPLFLPQYAAFFGSDVQLDLAGSLAATGAISLSRLVVDTRQMSLAGTLELSADRLPVRFDLQGKIASDDGTAVLLPTTGQDETRLGAAEISLTYDSARDQGWRGQATVSQLQTAGGQFGQVLVTGSGRIGRTPQGNVIGATLRAVAAGLAPTDPGLAQALGEAATGEMLLSWQEGQPLRLSNLTVAGSDYTLTARGKIGGLSGGFALEGSVEGQVANASRFSTLAGRPLAGAVTLTAEGRGSLLGGDFDLAGQIAGENLSIGQAEADALLQGSSSIVFSVARTGTGTQIRDLQVLASNLSLTARGELSSQGSDLSADLSFDNLRTLGPAWGGSLRGNARWTGTAANGRLTVGATGQALTTGQRTLDRLLTGTSRLELSLQNQGKRLRIDRFSLTNPQFDAGISGSVEEGRRQLDISARLANLGLIIPEFPGALTVSGRAVDSGNGFQLDLKGAGPGQIAAAVTGRVAPGFATGDLRLTGTAQAALANPFIEPRTVSGPVTFDLRLNGAFALRSVSGQIKLANGRIAAPLLRIGVEGLTANANLANGRAKVSAQGRVSAGGAVSVDGTIGLEPPFQADLAVTPQNMVLRDPELYEAQVTGQLRVTGPLTGGGRIAGTLRLPQVEIRVPNTTLAGTTAIPEIRHVNEPAAVRQTRAKAGLLQDADGTRGRTAARPFALDIRIDAPNRVFIRGRGLDAELGGALQLAGTTANVVPSGGINLIRGRMDILGRRLDLSEAQLQLEGNLDPVLNIVASNTSDGVTSSVVLSGQLSDLTVRFTSQPQMPEEEVLARLLFGRDLTALSPFQALQLANAVATLAGRGGEGIITKLRRGFGLDDLDVLTNADGETGLRLGRYLADDIYTDVTVGSQGTTQLNLNLNIRPGVVLRGSADSNGDTTVGVFLDRDY